MLAHSTLIHVSACQLSLKIAMSSAWITANSETISRTPDRAVTSGLPTTRLESPRLLRNVARLMDEERCLTANLSGYDTYRDKVRHRFDCERLVGLFGPLFFCRARPCQ